MTVTNEAVETHGYVKLHRKLLDSRVFKHDGLCRTWIWCLLKATHKQRWVTISTGKGSTEVLLQPGQFIFGRESAARELGVPPSTIRNWIKKLKNLENLDIQQDRHYSIISIRNWHTYQAQDDEPGQPIGQQKDSQRTAKGHKQECKECKEYIKTPPIGPPHEKPEDKTAEQAKEVVAYLNQKTGRNYRDVSHITARLRDGATVEQCKHVIDVKLHDPFFRDNPKNLNPVTLFRPTHWDKYVNERIEDYQEEERKRNGGNGEGSAYVPTPYELECLKVITHEEMTPEQIAAADAARERAMAQLREMPWWKDSSK